nr:hypothetical protein [uncultured Pseudoxanthomonas sp.]
MLHQTTHAFLATKSPLGLRRFGETDLGTLFDIESDPFLKQYVGGSVKTSRSEWICNAARITQSENQYALEHIPTGFLAGRLSLGHYDGPDNREIQVILAKNFVVRRMG